MKYRLIIAILGLLFALPLFTPLAANAQDSVSTADVTFTPVAKPSVKVEKKVAKPAPVKKSEQTLWFLFFTSFGAGLAAFFMPCIYPMLPLTIGYFTKTSTSKSSGVGKALIYGLSIIVIYVVLGLLVAVIFGASALNNLATNGVFNMMLFIMLAVFASSFLGAFEITLPARWGNAMDARADKKGMAGLFFMAAALAIVSFSCTGAIVGGLLAQAATTGALLAPTVGMFGFSLALALPFTLFAMFPGWMSSLPKSGGWLNSVKVVLGFLELALSFKFLSNVDLAYHWHLFDREVFLVLWIVIFGMMGFYLLGKLKLSHDSDLPYISVPRLLMAVVILSFTVYMIPGLWGAPLKSISAMLPPMATQDFDLSSGPSSGVANAGNVIDTAARKYGKLFDKPKGFNPYFDYDEGLAYAKKMHKPVMIDFTGHACVNCRKMEANVWPDAKVAPLINQQYVLIQLYVDDKTELAANEQTVTSDGKAIKTIGDKWSYLQTSKFVSNSQPFYVLLDPETQEPLVDPQGANYDALLYANYLESGLTAFHKR